MNDIPASPDNWATVDALIKLATDPAACRTRLARLAKMHEQTAAAEQRLTERTARHDEKVARDRAELDERKARLDARALQLSHREVAAEQIIQRARSDRLDRSRPLANGMTITQEQP
jgi:hypothetical protein